MSRWRSIAVPVVALACSGPPAAATELAPPAGVTVTPLAGAQPLHVADLTGDGTADLLVRRRGVPELWPGRAGGGWAPAVATTAPRGPITVEQVVDVDRDGPQDLLVTQPASDGASRIQLWSGAGSGRLTVAALGRVRGLASRVQVVDVDRDGRLDLVFAAELDGRVRLCVRRGVAGGFAPASGIAGYRLRSEAVVLRTGDVDGDGWADLLLDDEDRTRLVRSSSSRRYTTERIRGLDGVIVRALHDMDGDGRLDVIGLGTAHAPVVALGIEATRFGAPRVLAQQGAADLAIAGIDGDGSAEVVLTGDSVSLIAGGAALHLPGSLVGTGDVDGDGREEVVTLWGEVVAVLGRFVDGTPPLPAFGAEYHRHRLVDCVRFGVPPAELAPTEVLYSGGSFAVGDPAPTTCVARHPGRHVAYAVRDGRPVAMATFDVPPVVVPVPAPACLSGGRTVRASEHARLFRRVEDVATVRDGWTRAWVHYGCLRHRRAVHRLVVEGHGTSIEGAYDRVLRTDLVGSWVLMELLSCEECDHSGPGGAVVWNLRSGLRTSIRYGSEPVDVELLPDGTVLWVGFDGAVYRADGNGRERIGHADRACRRGRCDATLRRRGTTVSWRDHGRRRTLRCHRTRCTAVWGT